MDLYTVHLAEVLFYDLLLEIHIKVFLHFCVPVSSRPSLALFHSVSVSSLPPLNPSGLDSCHCVMAGVAIGAKWTQNADSTHGGLESDVNDFYS